MTDKFYKAKDPDATLDYILDWSLWLNAGDTISSSTWEVPAGITKVSESYTAKTATVILSGGTEPNNYIVTNRITTAAGLIDDRSINITIKSK